MSELRKSNREKRNRRIVVNVLQLIFGLVCLGYYVLCYRAEGAGVSILYVWIIIGAALVIKSALALCVAGKRVSVLRVFFSLFDIALAIFLSTVLIFSAYVISDMGDEAPPDCDYVIVLGASVIGTEPSPILQDRIDAAYSYLSDNEQTKAIGTGGMTGNGDMSEGKCIVDTLADMGISPDRLEIESRATTTVENMKFSAEMIPKEAEKIVVVSNGFHIFRAKVILSNFTDAKIYGIGAKGGGITIPHYILREYAAMIVDLAQGNYHL